MAIEIPRKSETTGKLIEHLQKSFPQEGDLGLFKRCSIFAGEHYAHIDHPVGKPYIQYASDLAVRLCDIHTDPILIAAALLFPPPTAQEQVLDEIRNDFKDRKELVELIEDIMCLERLEWNAWSASLEARAAHEGKERLAVLHKMFFLAIDENSIEHSGQQAEADHFQKREKQVENIIRMFLATATDIRALIFKLADRLYFIKLLKDLSPQQQESIHALIHAQITLAIYAPLADRLGIWHIKSELEDMAFRLLQPEKYKEIAMRLEVKKEERKKHINDIISRIRAQLAAFGMETAEISGRAKHIYSIYQKMQAKQLTFEQINDLLGIRIIVDTIEDCYTAQAILHEFWPPLTEVYNGKPGRDWIARPKENLYQSLHTTIQIGNKMVEVQIRTRQMHETAEFGVAAAHWRYKESKAYRKGKIVRIAKTREQLWDELLAIIRKNLAGAQQSSPSSQADLLRGRVFVITPKGHVLDFPSGATALDFAYRIHTELGNRYTGAKIGDRLVRLDYKLQTGDIVELIKSRAGRGPSPEWLATSRDEEGNTSYVFARTPQARSKIRHELKQRPKT